MGAILSLKGNSTNFYLLSGKRKYIRDSQKNWKIVDKWKETILYFNVTMI